MLSLKGLYGKRDLVVLAGFRGFHGILQQIEKQLLDHHGVTHEFVSRAQNRDLDLHAEAFGLDQGELHGGRNDFVNGDGGNVGFTSFSLGKAADAADDVSGALRLIDDFG